MCSKRCRTRRRPRNAAAGSGAAELELDLLAVLVVPVAADLAEAEPAYERERGLVRGPDRGDDPLDSLLASPADESADGLRGVALPPEVGEDRVSDLDGLGILARVRARRSVKTDVADHPALQNDGVHVP